MTELSLALGSMLALLAACGAAALWAGQSHRQALNMVEDLLEVEIPPQLAAEPTGERMREARHRLAERRRTRRGRARGRNDLEARIRAAGVDPGAVDIPEPVEFDVPENVDDDGVLMPMGRELDD